MYAVVRTGGKQYRVAPGDTIKVEKLEGEKGTSIELEVLLVVDGETITLGTPLVAGARATAQILGTDKGNKVIIYKYRRRKRYRRKTGHRQWLTSLEIIDIARA